MLRQLGANAARAARRVVARGALPREGFWVVCSLGPDPEDLQTPGLRLGRAPRQTLLETLATLEAAAVDPAVSGVVLRFRDSLHGFAGALTLRRAVDRLRDADVAVVAWGESLNARDYLVASGARRVFLPPTGSLQLVGLRSEQVFLRDLLDRFEVKPEVVRVGRHKGAAEMFTRRSMSAEQRQQVDAWMDDLWEQLVGAVARGRGLTPEGVRDRIDAGPHRSEAAVEAGLVDGVCYPDELPERLEAETPLPPGERPGPRRVRLVDAAIYAELRAVDPGWRPLSGDLPRIAYVVAEGPIHRGGGVRGIASDVFRRLLDGVARETDVRGVVLRIDSPGGDGLASDLLHRGVEQLRREKPVVVSMGEVAASGGYYLAAAADAVFAEAGTLTGSIGVVGGKVNLEGLYRRIGVAKQAVERGARAGLLADDRGFTPDERDAVRADMRAVYATFVDRVARGRGLARADVERLGGGRVFSGERALALGLVDAIGGPLEALKEVRRRAGLEPGERTLIDVHPRLPRIPGLRALLGLVTRGGPAGLL